MDRSSALPFIVVVALTVAAVTFDTPSTYIVMLEPSQTAATCTHVSLGMELLVELMESLVDPSSETRNLTALLVKADR